MKAQDQMTSLVKCLVEFKQLIESLFELFQTRGKEHFQPHFTRLDYPHTKPDKDETHTHKLQANTPVKYRGKKNPQQLLANQFNNTFKRSYTIIKWDLSQG